MSKDPAFLFYSSDFLTGTMVMTNEQVGMYIRLLCLQHQKGRLTEREMLAVCQSKDTDVFDKFVRDDDGRYYNVRLDGEITRRAAYSESRRQNRLKKPKSEDVSETSESYVPHMETETETTNTPEEKEEVPEGNREPKAKRKPVSKKTDLDFEPLGMPPLVEKSMREFAEMRRDMRKPLSQRALEINAKELYNLAGGREEDMVAIVEQSIAHGWQGFFELKNRAQRGSGYGIRPGSMTEAERILGL